MGVTYNSLSADKQKEVHESAEERYLAYIFIQKNGLQHDTFWRELQNDYTKGSDHYPDCHSTALMFLDQYSKNQAPSTTSKGTAFTQRGKGGQKARKGGSLPKKTKEEAMMKSTKKMSLVSSVVKMGIPNLIAHQMILILHHYLLQLV